MNILSTPRPHRLSVRQRLVRVAVAVSLATGVVAAPIAVAAPAQAATSVSFCFVWSTGAAYAGQPVQLMKSADGGSTWTQIRAGKTNASGCGTFTGTPSGVQLMVRAYVVLYNGRVHSVWTGWTPYKALAGQGGASLRTGVVSYRYSL